MKTLRSVALALIVVAAATPARAQNLSLLGQAADLVASADPARTYTASGMDRGSILHDASVGISLTAIPVDPGLRNASPEALVRRAQPAEMLAVVVVTPRGEAVGWTSFGYRGNPVQVTEDGYGNSITLLPGESGRLRTRAGATVTARATAWGFIRTFTVTTTVVVPPVRPKKHYDATYDRFYDTDETRNETEGEVGNGSNVHNGERREVHFEERPAGTVRVTRVIRQYARF